MKCVCGYEGKFYQLSVEGGASIILTRRFFTGKSQCVYLCVCPTCSTVKTIPLDDVNFGRDFIG